METMKNRKRPLGLPECVVECGGNPARAGATHLRRWQSFSRPKAPSPLRCNASESSRAAKIFFLAPRRRSGERTEERGHSFVPREELLLSPALSSTPRRRGSPFGCGFAALRSAGAL